LGTLLQVTSGWCGGLDSVHIYMTTPFSSLSFQRGPTVANRFMLAPLTNQQSHADGTLSDEEHHWLTMRAKGGFGITMTCASHVQRIGQGFPGQLGCFSDDHLEGLTRLAHDIKQAGSVALAQLHHAGNRSPKELIGEAPVCPSDDEKTGARALTTSEVETVIADFISAAVRSQQAGFDGVELHGAHGYLICQFLSSELNQRTDQYGGSLENRARVLMSIVDGVRESCGPDFILAVRLSPERFGMRTAEIQQLFGWLVTSNKVDLIDMSLWDVFGDCADPDFAGKKLLDQFVSLERGEVMLTVAGKIHTPADVQRVLDAGVDIVTLGRAAILHHDYPQKMQADAGFSPRTLPVTEEVLSQEGLSPAFIGYMKNWKGFVVEANAS
jgi:2,4-dienoyl-CoA reductase-like NADH-dependent reductase (Old Yellow Enzyme family)